MLSNPCYPSKKLYLTRGQKQDLLLKKLLVKIDRPTLKQAMAELLFYEAYKGGILDIKG